MSSLGTKGLALLVNRPIVYESLHFKKKCCPAMFLARNLPSHLGYFVTYPPPLDDQALDWIGCSPTVSGRGS